jgi:Fe-S cluster assembly protein SufD
MASPAPIHVTPRSPIGAFGADAFNAHLATQSGAPAWWLDRKRAAYDQFVARPMPKRTDEAWRFSNIATLTVEGFDPQSAVPTGVSVGSPFGPSALTFVNNQLMVALADHSRPKGVVVAPIAEALGSHGDLLKSHFMAQPQKLGSEKLAGLHTAFVRDGAFIYVPRGVELTAPIVITHLAAGEHAAVFPHTLVVAEEGAKVTVVDYFVSADAGAHFACGANDLYAGHGAHVTYVGAQHWSRNALSFQFNSTIVRRDARVQSLNLHLGARQARHESLSQLQAPGGFSEMLALTVADSQQEFDQRTLQIHQAPNTKSDLLYKNALRDQAKTIFSGLIVVDPDAQKTDAYQSNRNLMLSEEAEANSLPGLEIQANDVRCTHGATSSRIDPEQEFYLQSRGIDKNMANELLTFGFFEEVLNRLENEALHAALRGLVQTQFKR